MPDDKVLSQNDIDRLMSEAKAPEQPPSSSTSADIEASLNSFSERLAALERKAARNPSQGTGTLWASVQQAHEALQALTEQLQALTAKVDKLAADLQATPGSGLHSSYKCGSCGSGGLIATQVKCTQCGEAVWWGWYPRHK